MTKFFNFGFSVALATLLLSSCAKEQDTPNITAEPSKEQAAIDKLTPGQGVFKLLSFDSKDDMLNTIRELSQMDEAKRAEWYKAKGNFESQDSFMWAVAGELEKAATVEEVRKIQKKYSAFFVWNNNEADEDMSPYIPSNEYGYSLVCNRNGEVSIAGKVCNFNTLKSFEETNEYEKLKARNLAKSSKGNNYLYVTNNKDRRFWAELKVDPFNAPDWKAIVLKAEKKVVFWVKYRTDYYIKFVSSNYPAGRWLFLHPNLNLVEMAKPGYYSTSEVPSNYPFTVGRPAPSSTMMLNIQSRGTGPGRNEDFYICSPFKK